MRDAEHMWRAEKQEIITRFGLKMFNLKRSWRSHKIRLKDLREKSCDNLKQIESIQN
jgi:hypothetical protein